MKSLVLLVCATLLLGISPVRTAAAKSTVVHFKASSMTVSSTVSGSCFTTSIASNRSDAYRCMVGNAIHDPCFTLAAKTVACPENLAKSSGVVIKLTKPLPPSASPPKAPQAWALILKSGETCNRATGTMIDPDFPYYCSGMPNGACGIDLSKPKVAYFARCATFEHSGSKPENLTATLATTVFE
jgi:hypothetical protein